MIGVVFIAVVMLALRVFGRVSADTPFNEVWARFAPWMWRGLIPMAVTGIILVIGEPVREFTALSFWLKMGLLVVAVISVLFFARSMRDATLADPGMSEFSSGAKLAAAATVVLWLVIIFLGRAIAYDVEVWGALT